MGGVWSRGLGGYIPSPPPLPSLPFPPLSSSSFPLLSLRLLKVGNLKLSYGVWGSAVSSPSAEIEFGAF